MWSINVYLGLLKDVDFYVVVVIVVGCGGGGGGGCGVGGGGIVNVVVVAMLVVTGHPGWGGVYTVIFVSYPSTVLRLCFGCVVMSFGL